MKFLLVAPNHQVGRKIQILIMLLVLWEKSQWAVELDYCMCPGSSLIVQSVQWFGWTCGTSLSLRWACTMPVCSDRAGHCYSINMNTVTIHPSAQNKTWKWSTFAVCGLKPQLLCALHTEQIAPVRNRTFVLFSRKDKCLFTVCASCVSKSLIQIVIMCVYVCASGGWHARGGEHWWPDWPA